MSPALKAMMEPLTEPQNIGVDISLFGTLISN